MAARLSSALGALARRDRGSVPEWLLIAALAGIAAAVFFKFIKDPSANVLRAIQDKLVNGF